MVKYVLVIWAVVVTALVVGCGSSSPNNSGGNPGWGGEGERGGLVFTTGFFTDGRDGKTYNTLTVGGNTWMADNLAYETESSITYEEDEDYSAVCGRQYTWEEAKSVCPSGWHLPSTEEWEKKLVDEGFYSDNDTIAFQEWNFDYVRLNLGFRVFDCAIEVGHRFEPRYWSSTVGENRWEGDSCGGTIGLNVLQKVRIPVNIYAHDVDYDNDLPCSTYRWVRCLRDK